MDFMDEVYAVDRHAVREVQSVHFVHHIACPPWPLRVYSEHLGRQSVQNGKKPKEN